MSSNPTSSASTPRPSRRSQLRTRRARTALAGAAALIALPILAACAAGNNPQAYDVKPDSGQGTAGYMYVNNVWVVVDQATGNAEVIGSVANTDPKTADSNQLTSVTVNGTTAQLLAPVDTSKLQPGVAVSGSTVTIPALQAVQFGQPGQPELQIPNAVSAANVTVGGNTNVVYTFANGGTVTVAAQVMPNTGLWANYNPNGLNASPGATATSTATTTMTGTASPGATGTATAAVSGTAGATANATGAAAHTTGSAKATPSSTH